MKVARLYSRNDIRIEDMPVPKPGPGEALIKTKASGICSGDVMPWYIEKKAPLVLGHEPAGEVVEVGGARPPARGYEPPRQARPPARGYEPPRQARPPAILGGRAPIRPGDRVFVHHHAPCLACKHCRRGDYVQCRTWRESSIIPGGLSEYILIPEVNLENDTLRLPPELGYEDGTLIEPLACAVKAIKRARLRRGDDVLVIGLGAMGMLNGILAKKQGAGRVIGADMVPWRLDKAKSLGFDEVMDVSGGGLGDLQAELVIVGPNSAEALNLGLSAVAPGGTLLMFTPVKPGETFAFDPNELYFKDINLITSYSCGPADTADALELISLGAVRASDIITHRFPLEEAQKAYRLTAEAKESLKCIIVFD